MNIHSGAACWICLDEEPDDNGNPLVRDCACRGNDAGYAHQSCIINYAKKKCDEEARRFTTVPIEPWETCPNCLQNYKNDLAINLSAAFVSYAKTTYGFPGNSLDDKMNIMKALNHQLESLRERAGGMKDRDAATHLIHELLAMVDQAKADHNIDDWVRMAPTSDEFQSYKSISSYEACGYLTLGLLSKDDGDIHDEASGFFEKARNIFTSVGALDQAKFVENYVKYKSGDNADLQLETTRTVYFSCIEKFGEDSEPTINTGIALAVNLRTSNYSIDAERLATKLTATSLRVFGETHMCTKKCVKK